MPEASPEERIEQWHVQARQLAEQGCVEQALEVARQALDLARSHLDAQHPQVANCLGQLAVLYRGRGEYGAAVQVARQAMEIYRAAFGEVHPHVRGTLRFLAGLHCDLGQLAEAESCYQRALASGRATPEEDAFVRLILVDLANLYHVRGEHEKAEPLLRQALAAACSAGGANSAEIATLRNRLGRLLQDCGDLDAAEPLLRQALQAASTALDANHPLLGECLNNLAMLHHARLEYDAAEPLYRQALAIFRAAWGEKHPAVGHCLSKMAELAHAQGNHDTAESLVREAQEVLGTECDNPLDQFYRLNYLARLHEDRGDWVAAEPPLRQALEVGRATLGEDHGDVAECLARLALLYVELGDLRGEPLVRHILTRMQAERGERTAGYGGWLNKLGRLFEERGDHASAEAYYQQGLEVARGAGDSGLPVVGSCLNNLAGLRQAQWDLARMGSLAQESLDVRLRALGNDHLDVALSRHTLALWYAATGDFARAEPLARQALEIVQRVLGERHPHYLDCAQLLGEILAARGEHAAAEPLLREVGERTQRGAGPGSWAYADALRLLVESYLSREGYAAAVPLAEQVLALPELPGSDNPCRRREDLKNLASAYQGVGRWADAEPLVRRALKITRQELGEEHLGHLSLLCELAHLHQRMHNHASAEALLRQALNISLQQLGERDRFTLKCTNDLGNLYLSLGRDSAAAALFRQVLQAARQGAEVPPEGRAAVLSNLGAIALHALQWAEAEEFHREAYELGETALRRESFGFAVVAHNFARALAALGRHAEAEPLYQEALRIVRKLGGEKHPDCALAANSLGRLYAALGRPDEALPLLLRAEAVNDGLLGAAVSFGSERQLASYLQSGRARHRWAEVVSLVLRELADSPAAVRAAFGLVLRRKAVWAEAQTARREAILGGQYPALEPLLRELAELRNCTAECTLAGPGPGGPTRHQQLLTQWSATRDRLEAELARSIPEVDLARRLRSADGETVARALPQGAALIEFVRLPVHDFHAVPARGEPDVLPPRYVAFVLAGGNPDGVRLVDLGAAEAIERMLAEFRAAIIRETEGARGRNLVNTRDAVASSAAAGLALRAAVFDPLAGILAGRKRLLLAVDGDLTRLPFEVLPLEHGGWLLDTYQISYVSTGRDILRFREPLTDARPAEVFADPDFDLEDTGPEWRRAGSGQPAPSTPSGIQWAPPPAAPALRAAGSPAGRELRRTELRFPRLVGTRAEGERVAQMLGVTPWFGKEACKSRLRACRSPRVLHVATHGIFLEDRNLERRQGDLDWQGGAPAGRFLDAEPTNPLMCSGLAFAGANTWLRGGSPPVEAADGVLTAEDVFALDLRGTELVVLSACETGLGKVQAGEGVFGLRHAFTVAGARTLVLSLWKVPDVASAFLMEQFYDGLLRRGLERQAALREAQRATREATAARLRESWPGLNALAQLAGESESLRQEIEDLAVLPPQERPYAAPGFWGAFVLQGQTAPLSGPSTPTVSRD
jgi:CHAT domain-containing protein/tetratricopeptide (TPR) repeat protein